MRLSKFLLVISGLVLTGGEAVLWGQSHGPGAGPGITVNILNISHCIDPAPEALTGVDCPEGPESPWTACPDGVCTMYFGFDEERCTIPGSDPFISFFFWEEYTNESVLTPKDAQTAGLAATELSRKLCYRYQSCPCKAVPFIPPRCIRKIHREDYIIKFQTIPNATCYIDDDDS